LFKKRMGIILAAAVFLFAGIAFLNAGRTFADTSSDIGYVDFQLLMSQHPDTAAAQQAMQAAIEQAKQDFDAKSATMNAQEKQAYYSQLQQQLNAKQAELFAPIHDKVVAAVKEVAETKGLALVVDKSVAIYGGQDITAEVGKKITGQ